MDTIEGLLRSRRNAIGFVRFLLAFDVLWQHGIEVGGWHSPFWRSVANWTAFAPVDGFFFLSGLLVTRSWIGSNDWRRFVRARALRILPGFWACLLVTAFVIGPVALLLRQGSVGDYFRHLTGASPYRYVLANASLVVQRQGGIRPLFEGLALSGDVNSSLWTLAWEVAGYALVFAFGALGLMRKDGRWALAATASLYALWAGRLYGLVPLTGVPGLAHLNDPRGARMMLLYALGMSAYLYRDRLRVSRAQLLWALPLAFATLHVGALTPFAPFAYAYAILGLALYGPFQGFDRKADLSYGVYIYAFPIQQTLAWVGVASYGVLPFLLATLAATLPLAWASWTFVERPAARWKRPGHPAPPAPVP